MKKRVVAKKKEDNIYLSVVPELSTYGFVVMPLDGKRPILKAWNKLTHTPEKLYTFHGHNIGVLTGEASGITVLDIDLKDDGIKVWENISSSYPEIKTPMVMTASGGLHIYFQYNKKLHSFSRFNLRGKMIGWDLLNNDRQAVAPPSIVNNNVYKWIITPKNVSFSQMPLWLEAYLLTMKSFK